MTSQTTNTYHQLGVEVTRNRGKTSIDTQKIEQSEREKKDRQLQSTEVEYPDQSQGRRKVKAEENRVERTHLREQRVRKKGASKT